MEAKIQEFIKDFIPKNITKEMKTELQNELECHIYDRIDYYKEIGYSDEECLEKALKDFCGDKQTKEQINKSFQKIHIPRSLADFFAKAIPITLLIVVFGCIIFNFLFRLIDIRNLIVVPLIIWGIIILIKKAQRPHRIFKSIIALVLVVPYFLLMFTAYFLSSTSLYKTFDDTKALLSFENTINATDGWGFDKPLPIPKDVGDPEDVDLFVVTEQSIFSDPTYETWIFKYSLPEYIEMKKKFNENVLYTDMVVEEINEAGDIDSIKQISELSVYGFNFKLVDISEDEYDCSLIIGTNDEKQEIAYICVTPYGFTPSFDDYFIKEVCAWRYFYFLA